MRNKTLRFEEVEAASRCMHKLFNILMRHRGEFSIEQEVAQIVGKAVELATATDDTRQRERIISQAIDRIGNETHSAEVQERVEACVARSDKLRVAETQTGMKVLKQKQFTWFDEVTGWKLKARPDFVRFTRDKFGPVIQIVDEKTAGHMTKHQKRFLQFLALVISLLLDEEIRLVHADAARHDIPVTYCVKKGSFLAEVVDTFGLDVIYRKPSIEMVVRLLGENESEEEPREISVGFKKRSKDFEQLEEVRLIIRAIEEAFRTNNFIASVDDWHCGGCPFKSNCTAYQATLAVIADVANQNSAVPLAATA